MSRHLPLLALCEAIFTLELILELHIIRILPDHWKRAWLRHVGFCLLYYLCRRLVLGQIKWNFLLLPLGGASDKVLSRAGGAETLLWPWISGPGAGVTGVGGVGHSR